MVKNVIFDLDGTLLDTSPGIIESVRYTAEKMGLGAIPDERIYTFIGPPLRISFIREYGCSDSDADTAVRIFRSYYSSGAIFNARPYDGMTGLCRELKEHSVGVALATNKPDAFAHELIRKFGFDEYFDSIHGADEKGQLKKSDLIALCLDDLGAVKDESVLIGDTENDAVGAGDAGIGFIAVTYGFGFRSADDAGYPHCIGTADTPAQISDMIFGRITEK